jgi:hypothetical protein
MVTAQRAALTETAAIDGNANPAINTATAPGNGHVARHRGYQSSSDSPAPFAGGRGNLDLPRITSSSLQQSASTNELATAPRIAPTDRAVEHLQVLGKWLGRVTDVGTDSFWAIISDQREPRPDEEVEIPIEELAPSDRPLLRAGTIFYWTIGYVDRLGGPRARQSLIRVQRRPGLTEEDLRAAHTWAQRMGRLIPPATSRP